MSNLTIYIVISSIHCIILRRFTCGLCLLTLGLVKVPGANNYRP